MNWGWDKTWQVRYVTTDSTNANVTKPLADPSAPDFEKWEDEMEDDA